MGLDVSDILGHVGIKSVRTALTAEDALEIMSCSSPMGLRYDQLALGLGPDITGVSMATIRDLAEDDSAAIVAICETLADQTIEDANAAFETIGERFPNRVPLKLGDYVDAEVFGRQSRLVLVAKSIGKEVEDVQTMPAAEFIALNRSLNEAKKGGPKTAAVLKKLAEMRVSKMPVAAVSPENPSN